MELYRRLTGAGCCLLAFGALAADFDAAAAFGARESVAGLHLSPDGQTVAYLSPTKGQGSLLYSLSLREGAAAMAVLSVSGKEERLENCAWVANDRLVCTLSGYLTTADQRSYFSRALAIDADGKNPKVLSDRIDPLSFAAVNTYGGSVLARMPESASVLMERATVADEHIGSRLGSSREGLRVDRVDTRSGTASTVEPANPLAEGFIADSDGTVRVMQVRQQRRAGYDTAQETYLFRRDSHGKWETLSTWDPMNHSGFLPLHVVDGSVYGLAPKDGHLAAYSMLLDGTMDKTLLLAAPDVDVSGFETLGYHERVIGVHYADEYHRTVYTDESLKGLMTGLSKVLPGHPAVTLIDASLNERKLLLFAGTDQDPGVYYLFDRDARKLQTFLVVRSALEGVTLATMKPVEYPARDGTRIPGYLTLPPGREDAKGLPAIVLPHGGPESRDVWGFDWLAQFYAHQGYAVLQPNFRGSAGYGEAWFQKNGFQSWRTAIGDVLDGAHWLVTSGVADPARLAVVGWSYGGYAALQAAVTEPGVFKAVVAIAPVTDLEMLKESRRRWTDYYVLGDFIGSGAHVREGSPAFNAARMQVPVLLLHGDEDRNVPIEQGRRMDEALRASSAPHELVVYPGLDHSLSDSAARADLLRRSDTFLRKILMP